MSVTGLNGNIPEQSVAVEVDSPHLISGSACGGVVVSVRV